MHENGSEPESVADEIAGRIRTAIAAEQARRAEAERLVDESRAEERRLQGALDKLQPPARKRQSRAPGSHDWQVSDGKVEEVFRHFVELREQDPDARISAGYLAEHTPGLSPESARRALYVLRERERIRISGKTRGGGVSWDLMPEGVTDGA